MYDLLLKGGRVATAAGRFTPSDIAIADRTIAAVEPELDPARARLVIDTSGRRILPGVVDPHVHLSGRFGSPVGFRMLVRAGVTAALDLAGDGHELQRTLPEQGCGLSVAVLFPLIPGETVSGPDPGAAEIERVLDEQLERGALGLKILGGHYPLTPDATAEAIAICARRGAYCAIHAGTTATGSDVTGVEELVELSHGHPLHVAHINSYCRGQVENPVSEAQRALQALAQLPNVWSESYLSLINGAHGRCVDGVPASRVVRTCLRFGGYPETEAGMEEAIRDGWGIVQVETPEEVSLVDAEHGLRLFRERRGEVGISFPVNPPAATLALALARRDGGAEFAVDAFSSDGGTIPRNATLTQALSLLDGGFVTLAELLWKATGAPAAQLGLPDRGTLSTGATADVIVVDDGGICTDSIIQGELVMREREIIKSDGGVLVEHR